LITLFGVFDALEAKSFGQAFQNLWFVFGVADKGDGIE